LRLAHDVKRTSKFESVTSAFDPKQTLGSEKEPDKRAIAGIRQMADKNKSLSQNRKVSSSGFTN
jgi:hypothetical protein